MKKGGPGEGTSWWAKLLEEAPPMQIVAFDIDQPLPDALFLPNYQSGYVVAMSRGVPRGTVVLDLTSGARALSTNLEEFIHQCSSSGLSVLDAEVTTDLPRISVVIPSAISRLEDLRLCLDSMADIDYPDFEVVLVDNRHSIATPDPLDDLIKDRSWLRVVREVRQGSSVARNTGVAAVDGEIVAFADDDVRVDRNWLRAIGKRMMLDPSIDILTGLILPAQLESASQIWFERYFGGMGSERTFLPVSLERAPESIRLFLGRSVLVRDSEGREMRRISLYGSGGYGASANMAIRRSTLARIGGFDPTLGAGTPAFGGEDLAIMIDVLWSGGKIGYEPAAFVWHRHRREYSELLKQANGYAVGVTAMLMRMALKNPRHILCIASKLHVAAQQKWTDARQLRRGTTSAQSRDLSTTSFPPDLFRIEVVGLVKGPFAYLKSSAWWRRESRVKDYEQKVGGA